MGNRFRLSVMLVVLMSCLAILACNGLTSPKIASTESVSEGKSLSFAKLGNEAVVTLIRIEDGRAYFQGAINDPNNGGNFIKEGQELIVLIGEEKVAVGKVTEIDAVNLTVTIEMYATLQQR